MNRLQNRQSRIQNPKILDSAWTLVSNKINGLRPIPESNWILDLDSGFWTNTHVFCGVQSQFQNPAVLLPLTGVSGSDQRLRLVTPSWPWLSEFIGPIPPHHIAHQTRRPS